MVNEVLFSDDAWTQHARMTMFLGEDSIYHPDIKIKYLDRSQLFRAPANSKEWGSSRSSTATTWLKSRWRSWNGR